MATTRDPPNFSGKTPLSRRPTSPRRPPFPRRLPFSRRPPSPRRPPSLQRPPSPRGPPSPRRPPSPRMPSLSPREAMTKVIFYSTSPPSPPYDFSDHQSVPLFARSLFIRNGFIKEDFDGSDVEKEGDNNVSLVPDSMKEDVNVQAEEKVSIPFPPRFTPCDETEVKCDKKSMGNNEGSGFGNEKRESVSIGSKKSNKINIQRTGGSLLTVMDELIKVGKTMDYNMEGCIKNIEEIIEIQG
nr:RNA-directed DNA polymerase, eukaryota, reverse transcriptase zinc-binding domain protein [Tanacetum cinerariifolium]